MPFEGWYHMEDEDDRIAFTIGWQQFREEANIVEGSLLLIVADPRHGHICLDFVEIEDP